MAKKNLRKMSSEELQESIDSIQIELDRLKSQGKNTKNITNRLNKLLSEQSSRSTNTGKMDKSIGNSDGDIKKSPTTQRKPITFTDADVEEAKERARNGKTGFEGTGQNTENKSKYKSFTKWESNGPFNDTVPKPFIKESPGLISSIGAFFKAAYNDTVDDRQKSQINYEADAQKAKELGFEVEESKLSKFRSEMTGGDIRHHAVNQITGAKISIDRLSEFSNKEIETWMKGHEYDHIKNSEIGRPSDIFTNRGNTSEDRTRFKEEYKSNKDLLKEAKTRISEIDEKLKEEYSDPIKRGKLFEERNNIESNIPELEERIKGYKSGFNKANIATDEIDLNTKYMGKRTKDYIGVGEKKVTSHEFGHGQESGYGLGYAGSMKASRTKHFTRAAKVMTYGAPGSLLQGLREGVGILNKHQAIQFKTAGFGGKMMLGLGSAYPVYSNIKDMYDEKDPSEIAKNIISTAGFMHGWRSGTAIGGAMTKAGKASRFMAMGVGGISGGLLGSAIGSYAIDAITDISSNQSAIRSLARGMATKELYAEGEMTQKALTMRQAGLQKLARSGLNDRGLLLGNEASIIAGAM